MTASSPDVLALPTVAEVLDLPVLRRGKPRVVAGAAGLDGRVRWVHVAEIADIAALLSGGELVLTTGIALPEAPEQLARYVGELASVGACGLVVELVRRWRDRVPPALVDAAHRHDLPLVTLAEETRFVHVTEAVAARIRDAQLAELRATHAIHETFTALTTSGAEPAEVLREATRICGRPLVLETWGHQVLAYDSAGRDPVALLADWSERSRAVVQSGRTCFDPDRGWLTTVVGARGDDWGRLVMLASEPPPHRHVVVAERAASALAVNRLVTRDRESLERQTHRTLLTDLLAGDGDLAELAARAGGLGVPFDGPLVGIAVRPRTTTAAAPALETQQVLRDLAEATALAARRADLPALVGMVDDVTVQALVALPEQSEADSALTRLAADVRRSAQALPVVIAVGSAVTSPSGVRRTLTEAAQVGEAALHVEDGTRDFHRLDDVRLRGLLHLLRDDGRLTAFAERELGPLRDNERLLDALRIYCRCGGNKSAAAATAHLSRTAYYAQLARIEELLGTSLDAPESLVSLHVALLAWDMRTPR